MADRGQKTDPVEGESLLLRKALAFRGGDPSAFTDLAALAAPLMESVIARFTVPLSEKDDLRQEALIGLYKAALAYRPALASFSTFAYLCMRSNVLSFLRGQQKGALIREDGADPDEVSDGVNPFPDPQLALIDREAADAILHQMDRVLSPRENRILALSLQGLGREEIASRCGVSVKSVDNALFRCRKKLKDALE
jgi:RNA polymerase sporulation-specific sigma factor